MIGDGCKTDADDPVSDGSREKWPVTGWCGRPNSSH